MSRPRRAAATDGSAAARAPAVLPLAPQPCGCICCTALPNRNAGRDLGSVLALRDPAGERVFGWHHHGLRVAYEVRWAARPLRDCRMPRAPGAALAGWAGCHESAPLA